MTRMIKIGILICLAGSTVYSQTETAMGSEIKSVELTSPFVGADRNVVFDNDLYKSSCLDLLLLERRCGGEQTISYGTRIGINESLFNVFGGKQARTRMIEIGKYDWNDKFTVPEVELWRPLGPGEQRMVTMNASGADGAPGANGSAGMNADPPYTPTEPRTDVRPADRVKGKDYANAPVTEQVSSVVKKDGKTVRTDPYNPVVAARENYMYAVRVFDETHDYYVLVRVDQVNGGKSVVISFRKLDLQKPVF